MTLSEFKAWFEGFTEDMDGAPSVKQFDKIKSKVEEIDDKPIEKTVFIDRYRDYFPYQRWGDTLPPPIVSWSAGAVQGSDSVGRAVLAGDPGAEMVVNDASETIGWDAIPAMRELGRAEAAA